MVPLVFELMGCICDVANTSSEAFEWLEEKTVPKDENRFEEKRTHHHHFGHISQRTNDLRRSCLVVVKDNFDFNALPCMHLNHLYLYCYISIHQYP